MKKLIILAVMTVLLLAACTDGTTTQTPDQSYAWRTIDATVAQNMMDTLDDFILLDVRRVDEFEEERIEGAILIPYDEIGERYSELGSNKNIVILIYCRSGRRSAVAAEELAELGFTNVYDFGGILDWSYETISG